METKHCADCGNPDCPNVSSDPYWMRCPASDRVRRDEQEAAADFARKERSDEREHYARLEDEERAHYAALERGED